MRRRHNFVRIITKATSLASVNRGAGEVRFWGGVLGLALGLELFGALSGGLSPGFAAPLGQGIRTNQVTIANPPAWLDERRVIKVTEKIQRALEWDIRRVNVTFFSDAAEFERAHRLGGAVLAVTRKSDQSVLIGPRVVGTNFDEVFGHELGHVVVFQKYKQAIPVWLEEGLANFASRPSAVDYRWLSQQRLKPVREMGHPFQGLKPEPGLPEPARYHYAASTALAEMLGAQCGMRDLLQLSTGKNVENYLATFCRIKDLDLAFGTWVKKKASAAQK